MSQNIEELFDRAGLIAPSATVDLDVVIRSGRRTRNRRRVFAGALVVIALLAGVVGISQGVLQFESHPSQAVQAVPPAEVAATIEQARADGTIDGPVRWVRTTYGAAAPVVGATSAANDAAMPVYLVQFHGQFTVQDAHMPTPDAPVPTGTDMLVIVPVGPSDGTGGGVRLSNAAIDLARYGQVEETRQ